MAASSIQVGGRRTSRPGVYAELNADGVTTGRPGVRRLVIIGEGVGGKPVTQLTDGIPTLMSASTARQVQKLFKSGNLRVAGLAALDASKSREIGAPGGLIFAKVNPATQGAVTRNNVAGAALTLTSLDYAEFANRISAELTIGTSLGYKLNLRLDDTLETGDNLGGLGAFEALYSSVGDFTTASLVVNADGVRVDFTDQLAANVVSNAHSAGTAVSVESSNAYDVGQVVTVYGLVGVVPTIELITLNGVTEVNGSVLFDVITGIRVSGATRGAVTLEDVGANDAILSIAATITANHTEGAVEVISASALDNTQSVVVTGVSPAGVQISETIPLNGTTAALGIKVFTKVLTARLSAVGAGNVTVRGAAVGPTAFVLAAGALTAGIDLNDGMFIPNLAAYSGAIRLKHTNAPGVGTWVAVVRGRNQAGADTAERVVLTDAWASTTTLWSSITQIEQAGAEAANTIDLDGKAINLPIATFPTLDLVVNQINRTPGFTASALADAPSEFGIERLDHETAAIKGVAAVSFMADLDAIITWVNGASELVAATRATGATGVPSLFGAVYLAGGGEGTATAADWQAAFDALKSIRNIVWVAESTSAAVHAIGASHNRYMEGVGGDERSGFAPVAITRTKAQVITDIRAINDRNMAVVAQGVDRYNEAGVKTQYGPEILAAMAGAMMAGGRVGEPLTGKILNAIALRQHSSWDADADAEDMIAAGLLFGRVDDEVGLIWERGVTSWRTSNNRIFTEISANDSANESLRRMRTRMKQFKGDPNEAGFTAAVTAEGVAEGEDQVKEGVVKAIANVIVLDEGDAQYLEYDIAPLEPTNFIKIRANLTTILAGA